MVSILKNSNAACLNIKGEKSDITSFFPVNLSVAPLYFSSKFMDVILDVDLIKSHCSHFKYKGLEAHLPKLVEDSRRRTYSC